jgi:hypothetical protein
MGLIDTVKIDSNSIKIYKENKSDKHSHNRKERKHVTTFKLRDVLTLKIVTPLNNIDKDLLYTIAKHA